MNKYLLPPLVFTLLLQACGSDSSAPSEIPTEPEEYTFSLTAKLSNDCGIESAFTDVELLLQDDTWQTLSTHNPDENGIISFVTESEFINYTIVAKAQENSEAQGLNVVSFYQASSATPSVYYAQFDEKIDNSSCECISQNLELSHDNFASVTSVTSSAVYDAWQSIDEETTLFEGVEVCRAIDSNWQKHSFSVTGENIKGEPSGSAGFIDDFSGAEDIWSLNAFKVASKIDFVTPHQEYSTFQIIDNTKHFSEVVETEDEFLLIFDTHNYISETFYQSHAKATFNGGDFFWGSSVITNHHQITSTSADDISTAKASDTIPAIDINQHSEIKADGNYDYSAVTGFPMAIISYDFTTYDPSSKLLMPAKWTFYGPENGTLAISGPLTGYEDIIDIETDKKSTHVQLIKSNIATSYQDYIKFYQGSNAKDLKHDFVQDMSKVEIAYELN